MPVKRAPDAQPKDEPKEAHDEEGEASNIAAAVTRVLHEVGILAITLLLVWNASAISAAGNTVPEWMVTAISSLLGYFTGLTVGRSSARKNGK